MTPSNLSLIFFGNLNWIGFLVSTWFNNLENKPGGFGSGGFFLALHSLQNQLPSGKLSSLNGGSQQAKWNDLGQLSQHKNTPGSPQDEQKSSLSLVLSLKSKAFSLCCPANCIGLSNPKGFSLVFLGDAFLIFFFEPSFSLLSFFFGVVTFAILDLTNFLPCISAPFLGTGLTFLERSLLGCNFFSYSFVLRPCRNCFSIFSGGRLISGVELGSSSLSSASVDLDFFVFFLGHKLSFFIFEFGGASKGNPVTDIIGSPSSGSLNCSWPPFKVKVTDLFEVLGIVVDPSLDKFVLPSILNFLFFSTNSGSSASTL